MIVGLKSRIEIAEAAIVRHDCLRERLAEIGADTREMDTFLIGLWRYRNLLLQDLRLTETTDGGRLPAQNGQRCLRNEWREGGHIAECAMPLRQVVGHADG